MKVRAHTFGVGREQVRLGWLQSQVLYNGFHSCVDLLQLIKTIDVGHVPGIQDIVQVLKERLTFNLEEIASHITKC